MSLCRDCTAERAKRRGLTNASSAARGYGSRWRRNAALAIRHQPWCSWCGTAGTALNPLTGDHIQPVSEGGTDDLSNIRVLCRSCNSRRGNRPIA